MKQLEMKFVVSGSLDGSLMAAIQNATRGLKGLKNAASGRIDLGGSSLSRKLQELRQAQTMLDRLKLSLQTNAGMNGLKKASDDVRRLKVELEQARAAGDKALASTLERQLKSAEKNLASAFKGFRTQTQDIRELESALKAAGLSINNLATAEARLKSAVSAASKAWSEQERLSKAYINQNEASMNLNNAWTNMSNAMSTAETIMAPIRASVETAMNYEAELSRSKALTQMDRRRSKGLEAGGQEIKEAVRLNCPRSKSFRAARLIFFAACLAEFISAQRS